MAKDPNKCMIKWCDSTDTLLTGVGPVCYLHLHGHKKPEPTEVVIENNSVTEDGKPETIGINVSEKIAAGDRMA